MAPRLRAAHVFGRNSFLAPAVCDFAMILLGFRKCQMRRQRISASPVAQNAIPVLLCLTSLGSPPGCTKRVDVASRTFARCNSIALRARRMLRTPFPCVSSAPNVLTSHFVLSRVIARCNSIALRALRLLRTPFPCVSNAMLAGVKCSKRVDVAFCVLANLSRDATVSHFVLDGCSELHSRAFEVLQTY